MVMRHTTFTYAIKAAHCGPLPSFAGASRFAYNMGVELAEHAWAARCFEQRVRGVASTKSMTSRESLIPAFNDWKRSDVGIDWYDQVSKYCFEEALVDVGRAYRGFFDSCSGKRGGPPVRPPRFKKKGRCRDSFRMQNTGGKSIEVGRAEHPRSVKLPKLGWIEVHDDTRALRRMLAKGRARILFATVSRQGSRWSVALTCEAEDLHAERRAPAGPGVGVDLGISTLAVVADTDGVEQLRAPSPRPMQRDSRELARLAHLQRVASRKQRHSKNQSKAQRRVRVQHAKIARVRHNATHGLTRYLATTFSSVTLEDLDVAEMLQEHHLARDIADASFGEIRTQLGYKCAWYGSELIVADRWFASSKTCSSCGRAKATLPLSVRTFDCEHCGLNLDRDANAAVNLARWGHPDQGEGAPDAAPVAEGHSETPNACGGDGSTSVPPFHQKQEASAEKAATAQIVLR